jgi:uncharacterized protein YndB with AHSA1/START domain
MSSRPASAPGGRSRPITSARPTPPRPSSNSECDWGFVTAWEPPHRLLLAWHLTSEYEFDPDPAQATEVEIRFTPTDGGTLVELEHRGFEKYGDPEKIRESVTQKGGWGDLLEMYAKAV